MAKIRINNKESIPEGIRREMTTLLAREIAKYIEFSAADGIAHDAKVVSARISLPASLEVSQLFDIRFYEDFPY